MRHYPEAGKCGGYRKDGELILQAEHLVSRERSVSFPDMRNIVCLCFFHHSFFKRKNGALYWDLVEKHIGRERWGWIQKVLRDHKAYPMSVYDWSKCETALSSELKQLE